MDDLEFRYPFSSFINPRAFLAFLVEPHALGASLYDERLPVVIPLVREGLAERH